MALLTSVSWLLSLAVGCLSFHDRLHEDFYFVPSTDGNPVEVPLRVGSFNIQTFGKKKISNTFIMNTIEKIIHRYDLIVILEVMTKDARHIENTLLRDVNRYAPSGVMYNITMNRDSPINEYNVFFYRSDKLKVVRTASYVNGSVFYRNPYMVTFETSILRDLKRFVVVSHHVKPAAAVAELNAMANIYEFVKKTYNIEDILFMGDFNADCTYVSENDWRNIALWTRSEFTWLIGHEMDTTTNYRKCALDRFVYTGENLNAGIIASSARAFDYRTEFDLTIQQVREISDHWPIEMRIRGKMSTGAEKRLSSEICFTVQDMRMTNLSKNEISEAASRSSFTMKGASQGFELRNKSTNLRNLLGVIQQLGSAIPSVFTKEQVEAIAYKLNEGVLHDRSSFADTADDIYNAYVTLTNTYSKAIICKMSTVN